MVARRPSSRAASAIAWPWLPDENATTPRDRSSGVSWVSRENAPRALKAPVRWNISHLKKTRQASRSSMAWEVRTGVRRTQGAIRSRAAMTSSKLTESWGEEVGRFRSMAAHPILPPLPSLRFDGERRLPTRVHAVTRVGAPEGAQARQAVEVRVHVHQAGEEAQVDRASLERARPGVEVERPGGESARGVVEILPRGRVRPRDIAGLLATRDRSSREDRVAVDPLRVGRVRAGDQDPLARGHDGVVEDVDAPRHVVVLLDAHRPREAALHEQIVVQNDVPLPLEEGLGGVQVEQVPIDLIDVVRSGAGERPVADQEVWPRVGAGGRVLLLGEDVVPDDRRPIRRDAQGGVAAELMLDLDVVQPALGDHVVLDQAVDELAGAVRLAEVHTDAGSDDVDPADDPVPGAALGVDPGAVEIAAEVVAELQVVQRDVVGVGGAHLGLDAVPRLPLAVERQVAEDQIADVLQADRVVDIAAGEQGRGAGGRPLDDDAAVRLAVLAGEDELLRVGPRCEEEPVARQQAGEKALVVGGVCLDRPRRSHTATSADRLVEGLRLEPRSEEQGGEGGYTKRDLLLHAGLPPGCSHSGVATWQPTNRWLRIIPAAGRNVQTVLPSPDGTGERPL